MYMVFESSLVYHIGHDSYKTLLRLCRETFITLKQCRKCVGLERVRLQAFSNVGYRICLPILHVFIIGNRFVRRYINFFIIRFLHFMQETKSYTRTRTVGMTLPIHCVYRADDFQTLPSIEIFFPARQSVYDRNIDRAITPF